MKIVVQDCKTKKFMRCDFLWGLDIKEELDFITLKRAISFGMKESKDAFQVVQVESYKLCGSVIVADEGVEITSRPAP